MTGRYKHIIEDMFAADIMTPRQHADTWNARMGKSLKSPPRIRPAAVAVLSPACVLRSPSHESNTASPFFTPFKHPVSEAALIIGGVTANSESESQGSASTQTTRVLNFGDNLGRHRHSDTPDTDQRTGTCADAQGREPEVISNWMLLPRTRDAKSPPLPLPQVPGKVGQPGPESVAAWMSIVHPPGSSSAHSHSQAKGVRAQGKPANAAAMEGFANAGSSEGIWRESIPSGWMESKMEQILGESKVWMDSFSNLDLSTGALGVGGRMGDGFGCTGEPEDNFIL